MYAAAAEWRQLALVEDRSLFDGRPIDGQRVAGELIRAGFKSVRIVSFPGTHEVEPGPLRIALEWFSELAALPATSR